MHNVEGGGPEGEAEVVLISSLTKEHSASHSSRDVWLRSGVSHRWGGHSVVWRICMRDSNKQTRLMLKANVSPRAFKTERMYLHAHVYFILQGWQFGGSLE